MIDQLIQSYEYDLKEINSQEKCFTFCETILTPNFTQIENSEEWENYHCKKYRNFT